MKKKVLAIGAVTVAAVCVAGSALAQSPDRSPGGFMPPFMQAEGPAGSDQGMMQHMGRGMMGHMGPMMQHMGPGMMQHMGPGMMHHMGRGRTSGFPGLPFADPAQLDALKSELAISQAQEQAWSKYANAVQDAATAAKAARQVVDPDAVSKMSPQDRYAFVTRIHEQAQQQFDKIKTAADELLAVLDDGQKATARDILPGLASFGPGPMHGTLMGGRHHGH